MSEVGSMSGKESIQLKLGNCLDVLKTLPDNSVDSIVTDPPYGLSAARNSGKSSKGGFMGKKWDYDVPSKEIWIECLRVLKHGGHLLAFGGTRTYHRLVVQIEDAGFEIRDQIQWLYGTGFPKSHNISKAIDKSAGVEREVVGRNPNSREKCDKSNTLYESGTVGKTDYITKPATLEAKKWDGWGTALKPANEPICLARKPLKEKTIAANVIKHGTGALNIDGCRIETDEKLVAGGPLRTNSGDERNGAALGMFQDGTPNTYKQNQSGRFPANVILDEEAGAILDKQAPTVGNMMNVNRKTTTTGGTGNSWTTSSKNEGDSNGFYDGLGGASRFFYCAKASKSERNTGLEQNNHPTVKPVKLMRYLCRLITPPNGTVLDPFMGSGTTGIGAMLERFDFIGIEMEEEYLKIAEARIETWKKLK